MRVPLSRQNFISSPVSESSKKADISLYLATPTSDVEGDRIKHDNPNWLNLRLPVQLYVLNGYNIFSDK